MVKIFDTSRSSARKALDFLAKIGVICSQDGSTYMIPIPFSPDVAEALLKLNVSNRSISQPHVSALARAMEKGEYNGTQPIILSKEGFLLDGQHRSQAVLKSKGPIYSQNIIVNADESCKESLDQNRKRSASDNLVMQGYYKGNCLAPVIKYSMLGQRLPFKTLTAAKKAKCEYLFSTELSTGDVKRLYDEHKEAVDFVFKHYWDETLDSKPLPCKSLIPLGTMIRAYYHEDTNIFAQFIRLYREQNLRDGDDPFLLNIIFSYFQKISKRSSERKNYWITTEGQTELHVLTEKAINFFCSYAASSEKEMKIPSFAFHKNAVKEIYPVASLDRVTINNDPYKNKKENKLLQELELG